MLKLALVAVLSTLMWTTCYTQNTQSMDYLMMKWRVFSGLVDVIRDGVVNGVDEETARDQFIDLHALSGVEANTAKVAFSHWWNKCVFQNDPDGKLSQSEFVQKLADEYKKSKEAFKNGNQHCFNVIFKLIDINKNSFINLDEYTKVFNAFGHTNNEMIKAVFEVHTPQSNGRVSLDVVVSTWVRFMTEKNSEYSDGLLEALMLNQQ